MKALEKWYALSSEIYDLKRLLFIIYENGYLRTDLKIHSNFFFFLAKQFHKKGFTRVHNLELEIPNGHFSKKQNI